MYSDTFPLHHILSLYPSHKCHLYYLRSEKYSTYILAMKKNVLFLPLEMRANSRVCIIPTHRSLLLSLVKC